MELLGVGSRVTHPSYGNGVVIRLHKKVYDICFIDHGIKLVSKDFEMEIVEHVEAEHTVSFTEAEESLIKILHEYGGLTETISLGDKWKNGMMIMRSADRNLKDKEVEIEVFFHKIVMLRDRLRVMEQKINAHKVLTEEEKIDLQQYVTKIYGSLTTFNVLFKHKGDQFEGEKS